MRPDLVPLNRVCDWLSRSHVNALRSHSAWSESSAACPRPRGGHRKGEKVGTWAFATLQRREPQGRAHIWDVFSCNGAKRGDWWGP